MSDSYRLIGTYSTDSGNLWNWGGPVSSVAFDAPGTPTPWGSAFGVSAFDVGSTFAAVPYDVLNTTSGFGSDELDLTSLLSTTSSYSVTNAPVFNWNGNPATPGFGCDNLSIAPTTGLVDTLDSADWGLVRDYELYLNPTDSATINSVFVTNYQDTNIKIASSEGAMVGVFGAQRGAFDMSQACTSGGHVLFGLAPAAPVGTTSESAFVYLASPGGDVLDIGSVSGPGGPVATTAYNGTSLITDGSTSLLDFYDNGGGNHIVLADNIASNLFLADGGGNLSFITGASEADYEASVLANHGDLVSLNASGSGATDAITTDTSGVSWFTGFDLGRDIIDMALSGGTYAIGQISTGGGTVATVITGASSTSGVVLAGLSASDVATHISTAMVGSVEHLYVS